MGSLSDYAENELIDHVFVASYTSVATVYVGLSTADPLDDASGLAEPSGDNYAREAITFGAASSRNVTQDALVTFNQASGTWGTITHWAIFDDLTAGNMLAHGALSTSKEVVANNTPSIASGEVVISFNAGAISDYLAHALLDLMFRDQVYSSPTIYVGLSTTTPADDGTNITEPSNNYARVAHSSWSAAAAGATDNTGAITFPTPSGSWGTITHSIIMDATTSGNMLFYGTVTNQEPNDGDTVEFADGDLDVSMS